MVSDLPQKERYTIGVISDTHGQLPAPAVKLLSRTDLIIHAGDVGESYVLSRLKQLAPVVAVRGNMDRADWAADLPKSEVVDVGNCVLYVIHDLDHLDCDPVEAGLKIVISGHSHKPAVEEHGGVIFVNPGSPTRPKTRQGPTVALIHVAGGSADAAIVELYD